MYYNNDTTDTYKHTGGWNYEYSKYNEYAFYLAVHYSFLTLWDDTIFLGGTLGIGYHGAHKSGGGSASGYSPELSGMKEGDIKKGIAFKAGGYVMYCLNDISFKALIEYKTFGGFSFGFGIGMIF
jgi:hypothetical protein